MKVILNTLFLLLLLQSAKAQFPDDIPYQSIPTPANVAFPNYLESVIDSSVSNPISITRITEPYHYIDGNGNPQVWYPTHSYPKIQVWNADQSLFKIRSWKILDATNYQEVQELSGLYPCYWSNSDPDLMWSFRENGDIKKHYISTNTTQTVANISGYEFVQMGPGEGNIDNNDHYVALVGKKVNGDLDVIVYDLQNLQTISLRTFAGAWGNGGIGFPDYIDWVSVSQSGNYVVIMWNHNTTSDTNPYVENGNSHYGVEVYNTFDMQYQNRIISYGNHGDLGYAVDDSEVLVQYYGEYGGGTLYMHKLDGSDSNIVLMTDADFGVAGHVSCRNINRPGWAYITHSMPEESGQMVAVKLDGSGMVEHFGHHFSSATSYDQAAMAVSSPNGDKICFKSDFGTGPNTNPSVAYIFISKIASLPNAVIEPFSGTALDFDGVDDYVEIADEDSLDLIDNYTIEAWIKPKSFGYYEGIISKSQNPGSNGYSIRLSSTAPYTGICFDGMTTVNGLLEAETWYHISAVNENGSRHLYVNGEEQVLSGVPISVQSNSDPLCIGVHELSSGRYFHGVVEEVRLWKIARTLSQIRENMNLPLSGTENGLVSYWQFNEGSENLLSDVNGRHGTLTNMTDTNWIASSIPFGPGFANTQTETAGLITFPNTGLSMNFNAQNDAIITLTRIDTIANVNPLNVNSVMDHQYWVVNRFGIGNFNADLTFTVNADLTEDEENDPTTISLYTRGSTADTSWEWLASANSVDSVNHSISFTDISSFGQFIIVRADPVDMKLNLKVFLEGPFTDSNMHTNLNPTNLPLSQPYNVAPWNYSGMETVSSIPPEVVDWVLVELRDTTNVALADSETILARQAAFLMSDGRITALDASSHLHFDNSIIYSLFTVIYHRNHLAVMSGNPLSKILGVYTYDFTIDGQAYGANAQKNLGSGVYGMISADANADGYVNTADKIIWENQAGSEGYKSADFDLNGQLSNSDKNDNWILNQGESTQVPQ